eukprot:gnl/MRDRNA2_/MRDRNA2_17654_c0_seq1.p1 gnl/MRDRNA2_/MRDRNA2_17654_c0~~gnl/MRDRNA2_/MRDRNA2_17654_c0_seq1.p1  ORF type:complete len:559 (-),score=110.38 gnl/MRDRNA2_/MRDRNA2_17654_c0_seq1:262-1938(-)
MDNVRESQGLVPTMTLEVPIDFDVIVKATLKGYSEDAECDVEGGGCSSSIILSHDGFDVPGSELKCQIVPYIAPACEVTWACMGCSFSKSLASLKITYDHRFAQGYELVVETSASSSLPPKDNCGLFETDLVCRPAPVAADQATSSQIYHFRASDALVWRGPRASVLRFLAVPTVYSFEDKYTDESETGLHLFLDSESRGSEVGPEEISKVQGVSFVLELERGNQAMIIERSLQKAVGELFGEAGGLFGTVMGGLGTVAALVIGWYAKAMQKAPQKKAYLRVEIELKEARNVKIEGKTSRVLVECFIGTNKQVQMHEGAGVGDEDTEGDFSIRRLIKAEKAVHQPGSRFGSKDSDPGPQLPKVSDAKDNHDKKVRDPKDDQDNKAKGKVSVGMKKKEKEVDLSLPRRLDMEVVGQARKDLSMMEAQPDDKVGPTWHESLVFFVTNGTLEDPTDIRKIPLYARLVVIDADADVPVAKVKYIMIADDHPWQEDERYYEAPLVGEGKKRHVVLLIRRRQIRNQEAVSLSEQKLPCSTASKEVRQKRKSSNYVKRSMTGGNL